MKYFLLLFSVLTLLTAQAKNALLVVENTLKTPLQTEINQWVEDNVKEGWTVEVIYQPPAIAKGVTNQAKVFATNVIWPRVLTNDNLHIFLVGNLPVPRTGLNINPDGHYDTSGAYGATVYYATPSANWTDKGNNTGIYKKDAHKNLPNDGRFDNQFIPAEVKASIGVLNLESMKYSFWRDSITELKADTRIRKYKEYFTRLHEYKTKGWAIKTPIAFSTGYPVIGWAGYSNWAKATVGTSNFVYMTSVKTNKVQNFSVYNKAPYGIIYDFKLMTQDTGFWSGGVYKQNKNKWAVLDLFFGSYQVDFGSERLICPLLAGALASGCYTWDGWDLRGFVDGDKTLGEIWRQTVNNYGAIYRILYGDPTIVYKNSNLLPPIFESGNE